jgi:Na+/proline symporter
MPVRLHALDLGVVGLYLVAITLFGLRFSRRRAAGGAAKDRSLRGYFLANKTIPWWAISLSIVSAETSTLTIIGTPGLAFAGDFGFLQIVFGYMFGRVVVALLFLPKYFQGEMLTAYQLIDRRFGHTLHKVTAGLFLLTRAAAEGVRVFAVSIVVGIAIGTGDVLSIAIISALTLLYTFEGGMAAVIWTDVVQMAIYVGGTLVAIWSLGAHVPGGWATIHTIGAAAGKFHMLNFAMNLTTTYTFWAGVLGGTFLTMASHGTDQLMVQRMLAAKNLTESRLALLSSGVVIFIQFALFLLIGAGLFVFYGMHPAALTALHGANTNRIFPAFNVQPQRRAQLAFVNHRGRLLHGLATSRQRPRAHGGLARQHSAVGAGALRRRHLCGACGRQGQRRRDRPLHRVGGIRMLARRLSPGHAHALCYASRSNHRHDHRLRTQPGALAVPRQSPLEGYPQNE